MPRWRGGRTASSPRCWIWRCPARARRPVRQAGGQWFTRAEHARAERIFAPLNRALLDRIRPTQPDVALTPDPPPGPDARFREDMTAGFWTEAAAALYRADPDVVAEPESFGRSLRDSLRRVRNRILGTLPD